MSQLTNLYTWRSVVRNGYVPLESVLSTIHICDDAIINVDPDFPEDVELADRLAEKFPKIQVRHFRWPTDVPGDGSRIGVASQYALDNASGTHCLNVQADEVYPRPLAEWIQTNWRQLVARGLECIRFKVLNLEHNAQQFQGGDEDSTWNWQIGAGYNQAVKLFKHCPGVRMAHDAWSIDGCATLYPASVSEQYPIVHMHDNFRDTLIQLRQTAANEIWTDRSKFGNYKQTADDLESTRDAWWDDPIWFRTTSRFDYLLPDYVKPLLGQTHYAVRYELLD